MAFLGLLQGDPNQNLLFQLEYIQSNGDIFEKSIPQHRWLFEL